MKMHVICENVSMSDIDGNATKENVDFSEEIFQSLQGNLAVIFNGIIRLT